MSDESDDNGYFAPVKYSGYFKDILKNYFNRESYFSPDNIQPDSVTKHIFLYFVDRENRLFTFVDLFFENGEIRLQDLKTGRYFSCLARIRGRYTEDTATWDRFLVTPPSDEGSMRISLSGYLGVDPQEAKKNNDIL